MASNGKRKSAEIETETERNANIFFYFLFPMSLVFIRKILRCFKRCLYFGILSQNHYFHVCLKTLSSSRYYCTSREMAQSSRRCRCRLLLRRRRRHRSNILYRILAKLRKHTDFSCESTTHGRRVLSVFTFILLENTT